MVNNNGLTSEPQDHPTEHDKDFKPRVQYRVKERERLDELGRCHNLVRKPNYAGKRATFEIGLGFGKITYREGVG
ncbi:hypothetical protein PM082_023337 [Marasmius tenuissimus]|nr:hypothetical protein PM082_023337 [Marasmius tenuissimus]